MSELFDQLNKLYSNATFPASLSGLRKFFKEAKIEIPSLTFDQLKKWSRQNIAYSIHKPARKKIKRQRIYTNNIDYLWSCDLVDVKNLKEFNDGDTFLLTCIDTFSKYAWVRSLKTKHATEIINAFRSILDEGRKPEKLRYDQGTEFINAKFQSFLKSKGIHSYKAKNDTKAAIVERFNRTLKSKMFKYFTAHNTLRYKDVLQILVDSYNKTYHRSIGRKPVDVNASNIGEVKRKLFPNESRQTLPNPKFKEGDYVRLSIVKQKFEKESRPNWTEEVFQIAKVLATSPRTYIVKDLSGELIEERIYETQLQQIDLPQIFVVKNVLKRRTRNKKKQFLVTWRGYPDSFAEWIGEDQLVAV